MASSFELKARSFKNIEQHFKGTFYYHLNHLTLLTHTTMQNKETKQDQQQQENTRETKNERKPQRVRSTLR
jgi:hypothetical protein